MTVTDDAPVSRPRKERKANVCIRLSAAHRAYLGTHGTLTAAIAGLIERAIGASRAWDGEGHWGGSNEAIAETERDITAQDAAAAASAILMAIGHAEMVEIHGSNAVAAVAGLRRLSAALPLLARLQAAGARLDEIRTLNATCMAKIAEAAGKDGFTVNNGILSVYDLAEVLALIAPKEG